MNGKALIMIDMQQGFLNPASPFCIPTAKDTVPKCVELIDYCHSVDVPVIYVVRHYSADGLDVEKCRRSAWINGGMPLSEVCDEAMSDKMPDEFTVGELDRIITKPRFSAFFGTELDLILRRLGVQHLILAGTTTPNCIRATCYDALSLDYKVSVVSDCTSSINKAVQLSNLNDMRRLGVDVRSCDELTGDFKFKTGRFILPKKYSAAQLKEKMEVCLEEHVFSPRARAMLRYRFGLEDGKAHTLEEVGERFSFPHKRILQYEAMLFRRMRF